MGGPSNPLEVKLPVYFVVTDGVGLFDLCLQMVHADAGPIDATSEEEIPGRVFQVLMDYDFEGPLQVYEGSVTIEFIIPESGLYHCELWAGKN